MSYGYNPWFGSSNAYGISGNVGTSLASTRYIEPTRYRNPITGEEGFYYDQEKEILKERVFIAERARIEAERLLEKPNSLEDIKPISIKKNKKLLLI